MESTRRAFFKQGIAASMAAFVTPSLRAESTRAKPLHLACNQYSWIVFYQRDGRDFNADLDAGLQDFAGCGLDGYEPTLNRPADLDRLGPLLKKHGLRMRSFYVNSTLHEKEQAEASIQQVLAIAKKAKTLGARFCVTNPSPIGWGSQEDKNDDQLKTQAAALNRLGQGLKDLGLVLAYHNHDSELRQGAREFHHMMAGTDPQRVSLCLDAHWVYRGCGNSEVAVFDILKLYGQRVCELHLRQSHAGTWSEVFGPGDIDYARLAQTCAALGIRPHCVLEQAVEKGTPQTLSVTRAFEQSVANARRIFRTQT